MGYHNKPKSDCQSPDQNFFPKWEIPVVRRTAEIRLKATTFA
jgi:hypothetical protein